VFVQHSSIQNTISGFSLEVSQDTISMLNYKKDNTTNIYSQNLLGIEYVEYLVEDFIKDLKEVEYQDVTVIFNDNVIWNISDLTLKYKFKSINGFSARIPKNMVEFLEKQTFTKLLEEDKNDNYSPTCIDQLDWGVNRIDAEQVWGSGEGSTNIVSGHPTGDGAKVAIIDTGIDFNHPDLADNYIRGYDFAGENETFDFNPMEDIGCTKYGHGTSMAGIIAAADNNINTIGVAPEANLYALKNLGVYWDDILDVWTPFGETIYYPLDWAIDNEMDIINMSLGGGTYSVLTELLLEIAYKQGITLVAAAGGLENGANYSCYPAAYPSVIQVGASGFSNGLASYSNYGDNQDFVAPGGSYGAEITSLEIDGTTQNSKGTSHATAHVSGVCALMHSVTPNIMPQEVYYVLKETAIDFGDSGWDEEFGWGLVQAESAVVCLTDSTDSDSDGIINIIETNVWGTDPYDSDSDNDGLNDTAEVRIYHSNPFANDTDKDSLSDFNEVNMYNTNPNAEDSDYDGYHDQIEILLDYNPWDNILHPPQAFFLEYGSGEFYNWSATDSPYNVVYENVTYEGEYYFLNSVEDSSHLGYNMFAETTAVDLSDWDGASDLKLTFRFRCRSNYSSSSVTQFQLRFYDNDTSSYITYENPTTYDQYRIFQSVRNGQTWINGEDSGWQNESFTLLASEFEDYVGTDDQLFLHWGTRDSWSTNWDQTAYLDYVLVSEDDNALVPNQPRDLVGIGDEVSSIALTWKSPTNIIAEEYIIERRVSDEYIEQSTEDHNGTIHNIQYWTDSDTLSTGVTYYYRVCAVQNDIEGVYTYWSGKVDGFSNPIDLISSFDNSSLTQNSFNILIVMSILSLIGISQIILRFRQSFVS